VGQKSLHRLQNFHISPPPKAYWGYRLEVKSLFIIHYLVHHHYHLHLYQQKLSPADSPKCEVNGGNEDKCDVCTIGCHNMLPLRQAHPPSRTRKTLSFYGKCDIILLTKFVFMVFLRRMRNQSRALRKYLLLLVQVPLILLPLIMNKLNNKTRR